jgi:hypothetical protein
MPSSSSYKPRHISPAVPTPSDAPPLAKELGGFCREYAAKPAKLNLGAVEVQV